MKTSALKPDFGKRLQEERKRLGLSQEKFADSANIKRLTQHLYEKEEYAPNYHYFCAIVKMGVDLHYLLFGYHFNKQGKILITRTVLEGIFKAVDQLARDENNDLLPIDERTKFFNLLCSAYNTRDDEVLDMLFTKQVIGDGKGPYE